MIHPTTKLTLAILLSAMAMAPGASAAVEIKLRDCVQANNSVIRLSDVADIAGASPTQARKLAALPLMPAPAEGGQRFLRKREIEDLLVAHGVDLRALSVNGADQVFGVLGAVRNRACKATWYRVQLPMRPNGRVGYVRARDVILRIVRTRIVVDLSDRRVMLFRRGKFVLGGRAAVGTGATPTPTGSFYVNQRLIPTNPYGPYGIGAVGISAFSNVLTGWAQGGPVAIHGTNQPYLLGRQVSNGCIRMHNGVIRHIFRLAYGGTPVTIRR